MALINSGHLSVPKYYLVSILVLLEVISKNALAHLLPRPAPPSHSSPPALPLTQVFTQLPPFPAPPSLSCPLAQLPRLQLC